MIHLFQNPAANDPSSNHSISQSSPNSPQRFREANSRRISRVSADMDNTLKNPAATIQHPGGYGQSLAQALQGRRHPGGETK